jgi:small-conductance mechanosensitive channel
VEVFASIIAAVAISAFTFILEEVIRNFAAGLFIRKEKRFVAGNMISVEEIGELQIVEVGTMSTLAVDIKNGLYTAINNHDLLKNTVRNYSRTEWYYVGAEIPMPMNTDIPAFDDAILGIVDEIEWAVFGREPKVEIVRFEEGMMIVDIKIAVKPTKPRHEWESLLRKALLKGLADADMPVGSTDSEKS